MAQHWRCRGWKLELASWLALVGALAASPGNRALAQLKPVPDNTLGAESSVIIPLDPDLPVDVINGGATRGTNLFHSFREFDIDQGRGAYFTNPAGIENILSRVTGSSRSDILGTLGVLGNANLFLINPNGIIFGPNARLDVGGSFVGTTANGIGLANGDIFSAKPEEPLPNQLLNVNPNVFFFNQTAAQPIINRSIAGSRGLEVPQNQSLLLVGGEVRLEGGQLQAPGGRVELGGLASSGSIELSVAGNDLRSSFPDEVQRADISLTNGASVNVIAGGDGDTSFGSGGSITVNAQNLEISGGSILLAGIGEGLGSVGSQGGNIEIDATDKVTISGARDFGSPSSILNVVDSEAFGSAGDIVINTGFLKVINNVLISSSTLGQGNSGNIQINATDSISVSGGSILSSITAGQGNSGNVSITAGSEISFDGVGASDIPSGAYSRVESTQKTVSVRQGGDINIQSGSLSLTNNARLDSSTFGQGNAGNIQVNTTDFVSVSGGSVLNATTAGQGDAGNVSITAGGTVSFDGFPSAAISSVLPEAVGKGGNINIQAREFSLTNNAQLNTINNGQGNAGNIQVNTTDSVLVGGGSSLSTLTAGQGNAGNVSITAGGTVSFDGEGSFSTNINGEQVNVTVSSGANSFVSSLPNSFLSGLVGVPASSVEAIIGGLEGVGKGGDIQIRAESLSLTNKAVLLSGSAGRGDSGRISLQVNDSVSLANSFISSTVERFGVGNGSNISIQSGSLSLTNGAEVQAATRGQGNAGAIQVNARDFIYLSGVSPNGASSGLITSTEATANGQGGEIAVTTDALRLADGGVLSARTQNAANGGNIFVDVNNLEVTGGGQILTTAFSSGRAGNITVDAANSIILSGSDPTFFSRSAQFGPQIVDPEGPASGVFANTAASSTGDGGSIFIDPNLVVIRDGARVAVDSQGSGKGGDIFLEADTLKLDNRAAILAETASNTGGNITLQVKDLLLLRRNSQISATAGTAEASGDGGNIDIDSPFLIAVPEENSDITANAFEGRGGNIQISAQGIFGIEFRAQRSPLSDITASSEFGVEGTVQINTPNVDPSRGLANLPVQPTETEVAQACTPGSSQAQSEFVITGRGGLPPTPEEALSSDAVQVDWVSLNPEATEDNPLATSSSTKTSTPPVTETSSPVPDQIVEAQRWVVGDNSEVILTASAAPGAPHSFRPPAKCNGS